MIHLQSTGFPAASHPSVLAPWIKNARRCDDKSQPTIKNPDSFRDSYWVWWIAANPSWHKEDGHRCLEIGGQGPWDAMMKPGANGLLSAFTLLYWWRSSLAVDANFNDWEVAFSDLSWVVECLLLCATSSK